MKTGNDYFILSIFKGEKNEFYIYKEFSLDGGGPISKDENHNCRIRNKLYERYLRGIFSSIPKSIAAEEQGPKMLIC